MNRTAWPLLLLLLSLSPCHGQGRADVEGDHRRALQKSSEGVERAFEIIEGYGRAAPRRVTRVEARERAIERLSRPLVARPARPEEPTATDPEEQYRQLQEYRAAIVARLRRLSPGRYPYEPPQPRPRPERLRVEIFDVQDLVVSPTDHRGPPVGLESPTGEAGGGGGGLLNFSDEEEVTRGVGLDPERLLELVERLFEDSDEGRAEYSRGRLVIRQRPRQLALVAPLLAQLRASRDGLIGLELRVYRMSSRVFAALRDESTELSEEGERALARAVLGGRAELLSSQKIVAHDGQRVNIHQGASRSLLGDVDVVQTGVVPVATPVVYVVHEGLNADIRATLDRRAERVLVDLSFSRSAIAEELELRKVQELEIELAQLDIARITATASLKVGRGALLGGVFSKTAGASACVVYVKAAAIRRLTSTKPGNK